MIHRFHIDVGDDDGTHLGEVVIDGAGKRHLGVSRFVLADGTDAVDPDTPTWDCREWQWWAGYDGSTEMRPRMVPAGCGGQEHAGVARVWSEYRCDGVRTPSPVDRPHRAGAVAARLRLHDHRHQRDRRGALRVRPVFRLLHPPQPSVQPETRSGDRYRLPVLGTPPERS